jgi:predicted NUDIX family NTP pyrophosphohydrolase
VQSGQGIAFIPLQPIKQKGGKIVHAWAIEGDCDPNAIKSNLFSIEWPPKSGQEMQFPEVDRVEFFELDVARKKIKSFEYFDVVIKTPFFARCGPMLPANACTTGRPHVRLVKVD